MESPISAILLISSIAFAPPTGGKDAPIPFVSPSPIASPAWSKDVAPVLADKCLSCHDREGGLAEAKLDLTTVANMLAGGKSGPAIKPGDGAGSLMVRLASHSAKPFMPPKSGDPLTSAELTTLKVWIDQGAKADLVSKPPPKPVEKMGPLPDRVQPCYALDVEKSGKWLAFGRGREVVLCETAKGAELQRLAGPVDMVHSLRVSPDGRWLAVGGHQVVQLWEVPAKPQDKWGPPRELRPMADRVTALDFSPDSKLLAAGGGTPASSGEISLWKVAEGTIVRTLADCHSDAVYSLAFDPTGKLLLSASADKFVKVFEVATGARTRSFEGHTHQVLGAAWRSDGKQIASASADNAVKLWDYAGGELVRNIGGHGGQITGVRWLANSHRLATSCADRTVRILNADSGGTDRFLGGSSDFVYAVAASGDGKLIAAGGQDGRVLAWDAKNGALLWTTKLRQPAKK